MEDALRLLDHGGTVIARAFRLEEADKQFDYICPECRTPVDLRLGEYQKYFAHHRNEIKRLNREKCPRYHEGYINNYYDISNTTGFPLVLNYRHHKFILNIIIPQLQQTDIDSMAIDIKKVRIYNSTNNETYIDLDYLLDGDIMCPINFIACDYYKCEFVDQDGLAVRRNGQVILRDTIGIDKEHGAIFHDYEDGICRRLPEGSQATVGASYYYLSYSNLSNIPEGISYEEIGTIVLESSPNYNSTWKINRICANIADKLTCSFFHNLGIELVERLSKLVLLWPPSSTSGANTRINMESQCFFSIKNHKSNERVIQTNQEVLERIILNPVSIKNDFSLIKINSFIDKTHIQIRGQTTPSEVELIRSPLLHDNEISESELRLEYKNGKVLLQEKSELLSDTVRHVGSTQPEILHIRNGVILKVDRRVVRNILVEDHLVLNNRAWGIIHYYFTNQNNNESDNIIELLFRNIIRASISTSETTGVPDWVKDTIWKLRSKSYIDKKTNIIFNLWLKRNAIPIKAIPQLKKLFNYLGGMGNV